MILGTGRGEVSATHRFERLPGFPCWTIGGLLHGAVRTHARGGTVVTRGPHVIAVRPRTPYRIESGEPGKGWSEVWIIFTPRPEWLALLDWPELLPGMSGLANRGGGELTPVLEALVETERLANGGGAHRLAFAENQLERALLLARERNPQVPQTTTHPAVSAAVEVIKTRWQEPLSVASLANATKCSSSHLTHLFTAEIGISPMAFLEAHRIERAKHLLVSTSMAVKQIAEAVGFANPFHFSTRFRHHLGRSPVAWRRNPL